MYVTHIRPCISVSKDAPCRVVSRLAHGGAAVDVDTPAQFGYRRLFGMGYSSRKIDSRAVMRIYQTKEM
jgi:hypothetical protein